MYNLEKTIRQTQPGTLAWEALTTGGFGGFDCLLADARAGTLSLETAWVQCTVPIAAIGMHEKRYDAGGLDRHIRLSRLPDTNPYTHMAFERHIPLRPTGDNAL